jgi:hypothetical protein
MALSKHPCLNRSPRSNPSRVSTKPMVSIEEAKLPADSRACETDEAVDDNGTRAQVRASLTAPSHYMHFPCLRKASIHCAASTGIASDLLNNIVLTPY